MAVPVLHVFVFRDGAYVGSEVFTEPELVVGSGEEADLRLDDGAVDDAHAILSREDDQVRVVDLGTAGGVRVNGARVQHGFIGPRDEVGVGGHVLKLKLVKPKPVGARPSALPIPSAVPSPSAVPAALPSAGPGKKRQSAPEPGPVVRPARPAPTADLLMDSAPRTPGERRIPTDVVRERAWSDDIFDGLDEAVSDRIAVIGEDVLEEQADLATPADDGFALPEAYGSVDEALASAFGAAGTPDEPLDEEPATVAIALGDLAPDPYAAMPFSEAFASERTEQAPLRRRPISDPFSEPAPAESRQEKREPAHELDPQLAAEEEEGLDEDEAEALERPGFSLLELIRSAPPAERPHALEVIASRKDELRRIDLLEKPRRSAHLLGIGRPLRVARLLAPGLAEVRFPSDAAGVLLDEGRKVPLDNLKIPGHAVSTKGDTYAVRLRQGQSLDLRIGDLGCHLRFVSPPPVPVPPPAGKRLDGPVPRALGSAVLVHLALGLVLGLTTPATSFSGAPREIWAEAAVDEVRPVEVSLPEPEPEPEPEPPAPEPAKAPPPVAKAEKKPARIERKSPAPPAAAPKGAPAPEVKKAGVLGALGKLANAAPGAPSMVSAASSLDAVSTPGGSSFRVGALIGKAPSSDVRLGGGGGGKPLTRGSADLLRDGPGFARIGKTSGGAVRGKVDRAVPSRVTAQGNISREEVAKVIDQHANEVVSCFERALMSSPGLQGKLVIEWTIRQNGRAGDIKQKHSTLQNAAVARCVMDKLKNWRFPSPKGGDVVISYPWNFAPTSY